MIVRLSILSSVVLLLASGAASALGNASAGVGLVGWTVVPAERQVTSKEISESVSFGLTAKEGYGRAVVETGGRHDIDAAEMEAYFGLPPGSISDLGYGSSHGVAIANTVMTAAGDHLRGEIQFLTSEPMAGEAGSAATHGYDDFAILIADGVVHLLADVNTEGISPLNNALREKSGLRGIAKGTGSIPLDYTFNTSGEQKIGFAVFNVTDVGNQSALVIDNLHIADMSASTAGGLLAASLCWIGYLRFRPLLSWRR